MNKASLIEKITIETGITKKQTKNIVENLIKIIINELKIGNKVTIAGFGTFIAKKRHARGGVNPQKPDERIQIPEVVVAKFKTGKTLKDALKGK
ncbi:MAG: HU family DNA-binding protein [Patescibacteria group bacterium]